MSNLRKAIIGSVSILVIFAIIMSISACKTSKKEVEKVRIGMVTFPGYAPLYLAKEKNFFENVDVDLVRIEAIGDLRAALMSGKIDIYAATFDIFQTTEKLEPPGVGFLAIDESDGADGVVVSDKIKDIADLKGKRVAAEPGLPPYFVLQYMLNKANLTLKDIEFKDVSSQDAGNAFVAGKLDAAGTYEPYLSKSKDLRNGSKILVSSKDIPGLIVDLLFTSDKILKDKPQVLKAVSDGWFKAVEYWQSHPDEAMDVMSKSFGVAKQELAEMKTRLKWMTKEDNTQLFDQKAPNNAYDTFNLVGDILVKNNSNGSRVWAKDKLTPAIIQMYK